jgi:DNA topoisomerase-2
MEEKSLFFQVEKKTDKQHILDNPDTYIGSVENVDTNAWIYSEEKDKIIETNISYIPGLFKLFDEGIVNCRDHAVRMKPQVSENKENALAVSNIHITITEDGTITMMNDGNGIDVVEHPEYKVWVPELIFAHLRTSTNYNKTEEKIVGGKNGFGVKLIFIWSSYGKVETVDHIRGLKYVQEYSENLNQIVKPTITKCKTKPYTKITFKPDYARLGLTELTETMRQLFKKRVYDIAAMTDTNIKVKFNEQLVPVRNFQQYIDFYIGNKTEAERVYEEGGERWEYAVALTPSNEFVQVSFVNGIHTSKGGKHVDYIMNQITKKLVDYIEKKKKTTVNPNIIKNQLILFLRCDVINPSFDSQTKDYLNTPAKQFGSKCDVSDKFAEKIATKLGVLETACALTEIKEQKTAKKNDGTKTKNIRGIPKLTDANWAGTDKSSECTLILCEGDSPKSSVLSGLTSADKNTIGVYPLKGKLLNVRDETVAKITANKEITELKKILGLEMKKEYKSIEEVYKYLRYGRVMILTDQDLDGSHIKGLIINLLETEWPSLLELDGFLVFMNTPILKAKKGTQEIAFYNDGEYKKWLETNPKGWKTKYYKGLGTSTSKEFREYFEKKKMVSFYSTEKSKPTIDMVFNSKRSNDRKEWLLTYQRDFYLDTSNPRVSYEEFIHKELIHFSKYNCDRSIPNIMDGLKISLRKIVYAAFKRNLTKEEIKVAQFSGYVSEHSGYHHGEASLNSAIIGMAQNFVGSNNINLFLPLGQFGTRLHGGNDSASERYTFTMLNPITRAIFIPSDDNILHYLDDDGQLVEPIYYAPIIPMVLVNGSKGIGTGFSTDIMCYNPIEIMDYLTEKLTGKEWQDGVYHFLPYYDGFQGSIIAISSGKFLFKGKYEKIANESDKIRITELPVGFWTQDFKEHLDTLLEPDVSKDGTKTVSIVKDYANYSTDTEVNFEVIFAKGKVAELESNLFENGTNALEKLLKLYTTNTNTNMHLFDAKDKLQKYNNIKDIIDAYYDVRLHLYQTRKENLIKNLENELLFVKNKVRFILENLTGTIDLRKKRTEEVVQLLRTKNYDEMTNHEGSSSYYYLIKLPMDSVTQENVEKMQGELQDKEKLLEEIRETPTTLMWLKELTTLRSLYLNYKQERETDRLHLTSLKTANKKIVRKIKIG